MDLHPSARKHGISDEAIRHAIVHALHLDEIGDGPPWRTLILGPDRAGNLLEIVVIERHDRGPLVIHAMRMRSRYRARLLWKPGEVDRD